MIIIRGNVRARLSSATAQERRWLTDYLSFPDVRWQAEEGSVRCQISDIDDTFLAGYLPLIVTKAATDGVALQVVDKRPHVCTRDPAADLEWLRHHPATAEPITHQIDAVDAVCAQERGIIWVPTGGGKSEIMIGLTRALPCRWLCLINSKDLVHQLAKRYRDRTGRTAGIVGDDIWEARWPFVVATFQTLHAALKKGDPRAKALLTEAQGLMVDEAHTLAAASFARVSLQTVNAFYRVGLSGTPMARSDQRSVLVVGLLGPVIQRVRTPELQRLGILASGTVHMVEQWGRTPSGWPESYREIVVEGRPRNELVTELALLADKPALVFVRDIAHGRILEKKIRAEGLSVEFVWGAKNTKMRQAAIKRLETGETEVVICSVVFNTGIDIPSLASGINAAGAASAIHAVQRLGRTGRATADKKTFTYYDVFDRGDPHLERHSRARRRAYVKEGHRVEMTTLAELRAAKRAGP